MAKMTRVWWASLLTIGAVLFAFAGSNSAQDKKPYEKHDTTALYNSLRDVINSGAKLFNDQGDHAGCFRMYQGSLLSVKPFLSPDLQKKIDAGLVGAEKLPNFSDKAFALRSVLDDVRASVKPGEKKIDDKKDPKKDDVKKVDDKKDPKKDDAKKDPKKDDVKKDPKKDDVKKADDKKDTKKVDDKKDAKKVDDKKDTKKDDVKKVDDKKDAKKVDDKKDAKKVDDKKDTKKDDVKKVDDKKDTKKDDAKKDDKKADGDKGQVSGKILFQGKGISGGNFVTLISGEGKKFSSAIQKDGTFQFKTPIPSGEYRVAIEPIPGETVKGPNVPAHYRNEGTSGLSLRVQTGKQSVELTLVK